MQPQDQNYQNNSQDDQQPVVDEPTLSAEPLEPAPANNDNQGQPPLTPFVDGSQEQTIDESTGQLSPAPQPDFSEPQQAVSEIQQETTPQTDIPATDGADMAYQSPGVPTEEAISTQPATDEPKPFNPSEFDTVNSLQNNQVTDQEQIVDSDMASEGGTPVFEESTEAINPNPTVEDIAAQHEEPPAEASAPVAAPQDSTERVSLTDHSSFTPQEPQTIANTTVATAEEKDNIYTEICGEIIKEQEQIIGTLAVEQANYVEGLTVDPVTYHCTVTGDGSKVIDDLIEQYRDFFGHAAVEVCKEAASRFLARLPAEELPTSLR